MKQKFVNATLADRRKGAELVAHTPDNHPARETKIESDKSSAGLTPWGVPWGVSASAFARVRPAPKAPEPTEEEKIRAEVARLLAAAPKKAKPVPKSKILGMMTPSTETPEAQKYQDILEMLMAKK